MTYRFILTFILNLHLIIVFGQDIDIDSTIIKSETANIFGELYTANFRNDGLLYIEDSSNKIVFRLNDSYPIFRFTDFDNDGYKDLLISHTSISFGIEDFIRFDNINKTFVQVEFFSSYPESKQIKGTNYYYSFHESGCADMNWDSDLFYIENFRIIKIGHIAGRKCDNINEKDGIYVYKISGDGKELIATLRIEILAKYAEFKLGFISEYWSLNYKKFENR
jgi:hypothetical protein